MEAKKKHHPAITLSLTNQKGGVTKTTTTAALATIWGKQGLRVLVVDNDPQANLSLQFGVDGLRDKSLTGTVSDLYAFDIEDDFDKPPFPAVITRFEGVELIPSSVKAAELDIKLPAMPGGDVRLRKALEPYRKLYDVIILDSAPNLGKLTINVLNASDYFLVPVDANWALQSVNTIVKLARQNSKAYNQNIQFLGIFLAMTERTKATALLREDTNELYPGALLSSEIRRSTLAREAAALETPLPIYAKDSGVAGDYQALAQEIAQRMGLKVVGK